MPSIKRKARHEPKGSRNLNIWQFLLPASRPERLKFVKFYDCPAKDNRTAQCVFAVIEQDISALTHCPER